MFSKISINGIAVINLENTHLRVSIAPALGGKILSIFNKKIVREFLWMNNDLPLSVQKPGADYDSNFLGGVDELIPNDMPETIDSIDYPDHGELWTTALQYRQSDQKVMLEGQLALSGLQYAKTISLHDDHPFIEIGYHIKNGTSGKRNFLWKLHAALNISEGDKLVTSAKHGRVVDPLYSRFKKETGEFKWPVIEYTDASIIPSHDGSVDFLYLYDIPTGEMQLHSGTDEYVFAYQYDVRIFPYQWWFASYGGFFNHYTAILEPCTNMPLSVNEAMSKNQSAVLEPGCSLETVVRIFAGEKKNYITR